MQAQAIRLTKGRREAMTTPKRRWFRFTLRTLFVVVTVFGVWLGYEFNVVHQRNAMRKSVVKRGGYVDVFTRPAPTKMGPFLLSFGYMRVLGPEEEPEIPRWRRWFGDEAVNRIMLPSGSSDADLERARALFPEGTVDVPHTGQGMGVM